MPIYAVLSAPQSTEELDRAVESEFDENDRHALAPGVWFVRSRLATSTQLRDRLGIQVDGKSGVVIAASSGRYSGVADAVFVEKLQVWEGE